MSYRTLDEYFVPGPLRNAVVDTLDAYEQNCENGKKELLEATARVNERFRSDIGRIDREGPLSSDGELLVYSIPKQEWDNLCDEIKVYAKARSWTQRIQVHAANRVAQRDSYTSLRWVRAHYDPEDRCAVVVEHP